MNKVILVGRLTRDPEVRYTQGEQAMAVARYTLAVKYVKIYISPLDRCAGLFHNRNHLKR